MNRLAAILRGVHGGESYVNAQITARAFQILADFFRGKNPDAQMRDENGHSLLADFSRAELKVLRHIAKGCSSKEIAQNLGLKDGTVRNYISSLMQKAGLKNRTQIVLYAQQNGLGKKNPGSH